MTPAADRAGRAARGGAPVWRHGELLGPVGVDAVAEGNEEEEDSASEPGVDSGADPWGARRPTLLCLAVQGGEVGADHWAGEVLGQQVRGVGSPADLEQREVTSSQPLLHPQLAHH